VPRRSSLTAIDLDGVGRSLVPMIVQHQMVTG
jgi:hypothetical protein